LTPGAPDRAAGRDWVGALLLPEADRLAPEVQGALQEPDKEHEWSSDTQGRVPQSLRALREWPVGFRKRGTGK